MLFYCPACKLNKPLNEFHADRGKANGRSTYCAPCGTAKAKERRASQPEKEKEIRKRFYAKNRETLLIRRKKDYYKNQEREQKNARERYWKNPKAAKLRHYCMKLKALEVVSPSICCIYCGESDPKKLEIDHVDGNGTEHRKKMDGANFHYTLVREGIPENVRLQILCETHNAMKAWLNDDQFREQIRKLALLV